jgi:cyclopropane-fatty-acyl-phospholipid synthase
MFEHVGVRYYPAYFAAIRRLLKPDGLAMLHSIGSLHGPYDTNPWIAKYIFPGGYAPSLSEVQSALESSGLVLGDLEIWQFHYAETLKAWRTRFAANRDKAKAMYDERLCRMWEFYLAGSEAAFRHGGQMVFQMILGAERDAMAYDQRPNLTAEAYRDPAADGRPELPRIKLDD